MLSSLLSLISSLLALIPALAVRLLTLTTDFGLDDAYVAAMKGVVLTINPALHLVDVTHGIAPQDVMGAAFVLREAVPHFPPETVHLAVVDPGVGTERRALAARIGGQFFVGPDNGLLSLLPGGAEPEAAVVLDRPAFWRTPRPSATFHGRDIFAPVAAHLSLGRSLEEVGTRISGLTPLHWALPITDEQGIQGWVVHVDHFGNCITNISRELFEAVSGNRRVKCYVGTAIMEGVEPTYGAVGAYLPRRRVGVAQWR